MRLAIIDEHKLEQVSPDQREGIVLVSWADPAEGRSALAERVARKLGPRDRLHKKLRARAASAVDEAVLELQHLTLSA